MSLGWCCLLPVPLPRVSGVAEYPTFRASTSHFDRDLAVSLSTNRGFGAFQRSQDTSQRGGLDRTTVYLVPIHETPFSPIIPQLSLNTWPPRRLRESSPESPVGKGVRYIIYRCKDDECNST
ncbi:hypothetical protein BU24DRAFT_409152 [Aaosphaeria arxii CBS 175.79]|uniref:Uncharacterized protein n=1 Tax=Aaosphaeria arxii CBS 175.79 TaxID=1450172 RepID=A0A6A5XTH5_9PLEO|nr:uncharacterized protein BU24DRAFT_409152 [Aaosphaeria arxii CBS 175.79]KAF2015990.1 hypothetical protein BU24DRAFT_409152 [Aaosphaeria arxii CBS 175.79]